MSKEPAIGSPSSAGKEGEVHGDSAFPATEEENKQLSGAKSAANVDLCLSLGGSYGENSKEIQVGDVKCVSLNRSSSLPAAVPNWPESWAVESAYKNAAFCRAMEKLKAKNGPLISQDPIPIIDVEEGGENPPKKVKVMEDESPARKTKVTENDANITALDLVKMMPSVTTTGDGPNGKRIEGFLFKYKGSEIDIMCLCHGHIMSPSGFIKHAGGTEIDNPMKYISVLATTL